MPIGVPIATPIAVMMRLPTMALSRPPELPGGGVISVNTPSESPEKPWYTSVPRMIARIPTPSTVAAKQRISTPGVAALATAVARFVKCHRSFPRFALEPHQHQPGGGQHDERDEEEDEAQRDQ